MIFICKREDKSYLLYKIQKILLMKRRKNDAIVLWNAFLALIHLLYQTKSNQLWVPPPDPTRRAQMVPHFCPVATHTVQFHPVWKVTKKKISGPFKRKGPTPGPKKTGANGTSVRVTRILEAPIWKIVSVPLRYRHLLKQTINEKQFGYQRIS